MLFSFLPPGRLPCASPTTRRVSAPGPLGSICPVRRLSRARSAERGNVQAAASEGSESDSAPRANTAGNPSDLLEGPGAASIQSCLCWKCLGNSYKTQRRGVSVGQHPVGLDPLAAGLRPLGGAGSYGWTSWRDPSPPREGAGSSVHGACPAPRLVALLLPMGRGDRPTPP